MAYRANSLAVHAMLIHWWSMQLLLAALPRHALTMPCHVPTAHGHSPQHGMAWHGNSMAWPRSMACPGMSTLELQHASPASAATSQRNQHAPLPTLAAGRCANPWCKGHGAGKGKPGGARLAAQVGMPSWTVGGGGGDALQLQTAVPTPSAAASCCHAVDAPRCCCAHCHVP